MFSHWRFYRKSLVSFSTLYIAVLNLLLSSLTRGGGVTGIMTAIIAYYVGISELLAAEARPVMKLPQGVWYV